MTNEEIQQEMNNQRAYRETNFRIEVQPPDHWRVADFSVSTSYNGTNWTSMAFTWSEWERTVAAVEAYRKTL